MPARCSNRLPTMSTATGSVRQRGGQPVKKSATASPGTREDEPSGIPDTKKENSSVSSEWDYKLALGIITVLAFVTRFWGISHPNEVVFDEVHFGKVCRCDQLIIEPHEGFPYPKRAFVLCHPY